MTSDQIELLLAGLALVSPVLHVLGRAGGPVARAVLALLPDIVGAIRALRAKSPTEGAQ